MDLSYYNVKIKLLCVLKAAFCPCQKSTGFDLSIFYPLRKQWYIITRKRASHHRRCISSAAGCIFFAMMIYKTSFWWYAIPAELMIYTAFAVIYVEFEFIFNNAENIFFVVRRQAIIIRNLSFMVTVSDYYFFEIIYILNKYPFCVKLTVTH